MNVPNSITVFRILLIPVFIWQFLEGNLGIAALIFFVAWVSDVLDGYIARKFDIETKFGKIADPLADKLITLSALFLAGYKGYIFGGMILPIIVLAKELTLVVGGVFMYKKADEIAGAKWIGKTATFLFTIAIILMLFEVTQDIAQIIVWIALVVAFVALAEYVINFFRVVGVNKAARVKESE